MAACYAPDVRFSDPVFGELRGAQAGDMWRMLAERATDLRVELPEHEAGDERGRPSAPAGLLLGWTPVLRAKVSGQARQGLEAYRAAA